MNLIKKLCQVLDKLLLTLNKNRWIKYSIQFVILVSCLIFIARNIKNINTQDIKINYIYIILSLIFILAGGALGAVSWWLTIQVFGYKIKFQNIIKIQFMSNLAKYIPGFAWQILGKGLMTANHGVPKRISGVAIIYEYVLIIISGTCLAGLAFPKGFVDRFMYLHLDELLIDIVRIGSVVLLFTTPLILTRIRKLFVKSNGLIELHLFISYLLLALMIFTWTVNSIGFHILIQAISPNGLGFDSTFFALTATFVIGLLVVIVPGSFGIRESILILMLGPVLNNQVASIVALVFRLLTILSELLLYGVFIVLVNRKNEASKKRQ